MVSPSGEWCVGRICFCENFITARRVKSNYLIMDKCLVRRNNNLEIISDKKYFSCLPEYVFGEQKSVARCDIGREELGLRASQTFSSSSSSSHQSISPPHTDIFPSDRRRRQRRSANELGQKSHQ